MWGSSRYSHRGRHMIKVANHKAANGAINNVGVHLLWCGALTWQATNRLFPPTPPLVYNPTAQMKQDLPTGDC